MGTDKASEQEKKIIESGRAVSMLFDIIIISYSLSFVLILLHVFSSPPIITKLLNIVIRLSRMIQVMSRLSTARPRRYWELLSSEMR